MKAGTYTVQVTFLVEKDGRITAVHPINDPDFGIVKAVEKVIKTTPKW